jgi:Met-10+ like-protein
MGLATVECAIGAFRSFAGDVITSRLRTCGAHTRPELAMLLALVRAGDDVVDVGSHIGTFAIPIVRKGARGTAIEPQASAFGLLHENARLNWRGAGCAAGRDRNRRRAHDQRGARQQRRRFPDPLAAQSGRRLWTSGWAGQSC